MDAIALLTKDHQAVKKMLEDLADTTPRAVKTRTDLLEKIAAALKAHTTIEEEIFYPAFKQQGGKSDDARMFFEAIEEHRAAGDLVLPDLQAAEVDSDVFSGRAKVLKELVTHHADEEEEEMFPRAREVFSQSELDELGRKMDARKKELLQEG